MLRATFKETPVEKRKSPGERYQVFFDPRLSSGNEQLTRCTGPDAINLATRVLEILREYRQLEIKVDFVIGFVGEDRESVRGVLDVYGREPGVKLEYVG